MKIYRGLEYSLKIKKVIIDSIKAAKNNPFSDYYFIVDDPLFFEEAFFKYTDTLFNLKIINYNNLLKKLLDNYHLYQYEKLSILEKILITKELIEDSNNLFNTENKMHLIYELINIFDLFYLEEINNPQLNNLPPLSKEKITTIIKLYQLLFKKIPDFKCYQYEELLSNKINNNIANNHYIFITEKILNKRCFQLIKEIDKYCDVTILINDCNDSRDLNIPFKKIKGDDYFDNFDFSYLNHLNT